MTGFGTLRDIDQFLRDTGFQWTAYERKAEMWVTDARSWRLQAQKVVSSPDLEEDERDRLGATLDLIQSRIVILEDSGFIGKSSSAAFINSIDKDAKDAFGWLRKWGPHIAAGLAVYLLGDLLIRATRRR